MKKIITILIATLALTAQAETAKSTPKPKGLLRMMQRTTVYLDGKGNPIETKRDIQFSLADGKGNTLQTPIGLVYELNGADGKRHNVNPILRETLTEARGQSAPPRPYSEGTFKSRKHGFFPKRMEEGQEVAGTWFVIDFPASETSPARTERHENWVVVAMVDGHRRLRKYRDVIESDRMRETVDYWYMESDRFHPSLFTADANPKP